MTNAPDAKKRQSLIRAFCCAGRGVVQTFITQRNPKIHAVFAVFAIVLGFVLHIDAPSWLAVVICIMVVFSAEAANTALETVVDLVMPAYHDLARLAKDCAAGAVLICAVGAVVVACIVYIPPFVALIQGA